MQRKNKRPGKRRKRRVRRVEAHVECDASDAVEANATGTTEVTAEPATEAVGLVEGLGDDYQMNTVEVNEAALIAEAQATVASLPEEPQAIQGEEGVEVVERQPTPEEIHKGYVTIAGVVITGVAETFAPNWAVQPKEIDPLADAIAQACMMWFPDTPIPPKYLMLLVVAKSVADIVMARRDPETGVMRALRAVKATRSEKTTQSEAA